MSVGSERDRLFQCGRPRTITFEHFPKRPSRPGARRRLMSPRSFHAPFLKEARTQKGAKPESLERAPPTPPRIELSVLRPEGESSSPTR